MPKLLKKIIPKKFSSRIFWSVFIVFSIIISLSFTRNLLYSLNQSINLYLYQSSVDFKDNMQQIENLINKAIFLSRSLSKDFNNIHYIQTEQRRTYLSQIMENTLKENSRILACWTITKPYSIDSLDDNFKDKFTNYNGEFIQVFYRGKYRTYQDSFSLSYYDILDKYITQFLGQKTDIIIDAPLKINYPLAREKYKISVITPIYKKNQIIGILGIDVAISNFEKVIGKKSYNYWTT